jgi:hypothetical protein
MRYIDVEGERPSMLVLSTLLDVVMAEAARGQATVKDAAHIINRIKGCGFACTSAELRKVLCIVQASAQHGFSDMEEGYEVLHDLHAAGAEPEAADYLAVLDCAQWSAYWRQSVAQRGVGRLGGAAAAAAGATEEGGSAEQQGGTGVGERVGGGGGGDGGDGVAVVADEEWTARTWHRQNPYVSLLVCRLVPACNLAATACNCLQPGCIAYLHVRRGAIGWSK